MGANTCAPQQTEGGDESDEPEAMVAMNMRDKHMPEFAKPHLGLAQLLLCAFGAVDEKEFISHLNELCRCLVLHCWQCAAASKNDYIK